MSKVIRRQTTENPKPVVLQVVVAVEIAATVHARQDRAAGALLLIMLLYLPAIKQGERKGKVNKREKEEEKEQRKT